MNAVGAVYFDSVLVAGLVGFFHIDKSHHFGRTDAYACAAPCAGAVIDAGFWSYTSPH